MASQPLGSSHCQGCTITVRHTTLGRIPPDEWSARLRDLYLTTHNTHKRKTSVPTAGFEPAIPRSERLQIQALHRAATWYRGDREFTSFQISVCLNAMGMVFCLLASVSESDKNSWFLYRCLLDMPSFFLFSVCRIPLHNVRPLELGRIRWKSLEI